MTGQTVNLRKDLDSAYDVAMLNWCAKSHAYQQAVKLGGSDGRRDLLAETRKWHHLTIRIGRWLVAEAKR